MTPRRLALMTSLRGTCAILSLALFGTAALAQDSQPTAPTPSAPPAIPTGTLDRSNPVSVVEAVFTAYRTADYSGLAGLCPAGDIDGDVRRICETTATSEWLGEYTEALSAATVTGPAVIDGATAAVPITMGEAGAETMNLVQVDGAWYLSSF